MGYTPTWKRGLGMNIIGWTPRPIPPATQQVVHPTIAAIQASREAKKEIPESLLPNPKCDSCRADSNLRMVGSLPYWCCEDLEGCEMRYIDLLIETMPSCQSGSPKPWSQTRDIRDLLHECIENWCYLYGGMNGATVESFATWVVTSIDWTTPVRPKLQDFLDKW